MVEVVDRHWVKPIKVIDDAGIEINSYRNVIFFNFNLSFINKKPWKRAKLQKLETRNENSFCRNSVTITIRSIIKTN